MVPKKKSKLSGFYLISLLWFSLNSFAVESPEEQLRTWCKDMDAAAAKLTWKLDPCDPAGLKIGGQSVQNRPLVYEEFGNPQAPNTTLILSMVHSDEITPLYIALKLRKWLKEHIHEFPNTRVVVAPLVNPDGFFKLPRTRTNARGVDLNRNFATADWNREALASWKKQFRSNPRRFPGSVAQSEPETHFQTFLINQVHPQKILSIHAPLNFMDYDGPISLTLSKFPKDYVKKCMQLRKELNAKSGRFFPGSLGNYAGQERGVPTLTLELPSANPKSAERYWQTFSFGIQTLITFQVPNYAT